MTNLQWIRACIRRFNRALQPAAVGTDKAPCMTEFTDEPLGPCPAEVEAELDRRIQEAKDGHSLTIEEFREQLRVLRERHERRTAESQGLGYGP